ncbi:MAG: PqqD family protein [Deltaproteobacteria bacterium]|nr:PqqD family protein [Deltaproteobacteria bacterium]
MFALNKSEVSWRFLEDEAVLINLKTNFYYSLNTSGTLILRKLAEGQPTFEELVVSLRDHYVSDEMRIRRDIETFLGQLLDEGIVFGSICWDKSEKNESGFEPQLDYSSASYRAPVLTKFDKLERLIICGE